VKARGSAGKASIGVRADLTTWEKVGDAGEFWYLYVGIPAMLGAYCVIMERQGAS